MYGKTFLMGFLERSAIIKGAMTGLGKYSMGDYGQIRV